MSVWAFLLVLLINMHLFVSNVSSSYLSDYDLEGMYSKMRLYNYVKKIDATKDERHLKHKDFNDLMDTVSIVDKYANYSIFTTEEVTSLIMRESKFDPKAINKSDGGRGLGQLTNINVWWKKELFWITDPYDKDQNIRGIFIALDCMYKEHGSKYQAIKHYNGSTKKSDYYARDVIKTSKLFGKVKGS
jgi:soluble lytic murein transglycosylase-like protein